jgi:hypothetical protein
MQVTWIEIPMDVGLQKVGYWLQLQNNRNIRQIGIEDAYVLHHRLKFPCSSAKSLIGVLFRKMILLSAGMLIRGL